MVVRQEERVLGSTEGGATEGGATAIVVEIGSRKCGGRGSVWGSMRGSTFVGVGSVVGSVGHEDRGRSLCVGKESIIVEIVRRGSV